MNEFFPPWPLLSAFLFASFVLAVTPGPGVIYIVTRSLVQGRRSGLASVAGVACGNFVNALVASIGLAAVFSISALAFSVVKYVGAVYLIYLGIQMLRSSAVKNTDVIPATVSMRRIFGDGFFVALLNPKTAIFFAAFLPQFLSADAMPMCQSMTLGSIFVAIAAITDSVYAFAAGTVAPVLRASGTHRVGRLFGGGVFIGLGIYTAFVGMRSAK